MSVMAGWGREIGGGGMVCQELDRSTVLSGVDFDVWVRIERAFDGLFADEEGGPLRVTDMVRAVLRYGERSEIRGDLVDERAALMSKPSCHESCGK